ncbi:MAG: hypothetical protein HDQ88_01010 [Clostridia bacterium]|nr:hypothetical protein [Clostridia bacterium]
MACNDYFLKTFTDLGKHYNKLGKEIERTRMLMKGLDMEYAYAYSLRIHEVAERIVLLARDLPCHLGIRDAEERVHREMEKIVPLKSVIRKRAGLAYRCSRYFRERSTESSTT